jgi:nucleoside-diphosphate-sugar epimerase
MRQASSFSSQILSINKKIIFMKNISIIGGSGFIGTRLMRRLRINESNASKIIDKAPSSAFPDLVTLSDVRSVEQLCESITHGSVVVNLAAEHKDDVRPLSLYHEVNVGGARNICIAAREKGVQMIIFTSSVAVYGFAPIDTNESGKIAPFNDYGQTKYESEQVFKAWQAEAPEERTLVIIRPTVVFGEQNRGNVYNLLRQIASGKFVMIGHGENRKSMAYVENVVAFIEYSMSFKPGVHIYNYIDKPDFTMNSLVANVNRILGRSEKIGLRLPFAVGYVIGKGFDLVAAITGKRLTISSIRVKKFCANSVYDTAIDKTGFVRPVSLEHAIEKTVRHEFIENHDGEPLYFSE